MSDFSFFAVVALVVLALMGVRQVPQGYAYTVERFGKYRQTLYPGLGLIELAPVIWTAPRGF